MLKQAKAKAKAESSKGADAPSRDPVGERPKAVL